LKTQRIPSQQEGKEEGREGTGLARRKRPLTNYNNRTIKNPRKRRRKKKGKKRENSVFYCYHRVGRKGGRWMACNISINRARGGEVKLGSMRCEGGEGE